MSTTEDEPETPYYTSSASQQGRNSPEFTHLALYQATFLKGKPKILGIVLIVTGILQVCLGVASVFTTVSANFVSGLPFYGPVFYIVAGSLTLTAHFKLNFLLIKISLLLNILSIIFSFTGLIMVSVDLYVIDNMAVSDYEYYTKTARAGGVVVLVLLLITNLLICSVAATLSFFGLKSLGDTPISKMFLVNENEDSKSQTGSQTTGYRVEGDIGGVTKA